MIDYTILIVIVPIALLGSSIGVIFNSLLPNLILFILFAVFIAYVFNKTSRLAYKKYQADVEANKNAKTNPSPQTIEKPQQEPAKN